MACHVLSAISQPCVKHNPRPSYSNKLRPSVIVLAHNVFQHCNTVLGVRWSNWLPPLEIFAEAVTAGDWLCLFLWELCVDQLSCPKGMTDDDFQTLVTQMAKQCHRRSGCLDPDTNQAWLNRFWLVTALHAKIRSNKVVSKLQKAKKADAIVKLTAQVRDA